MKKKAVVNDDSLNYSVHADKNGVLFGSRTDNEKNSLNNKSSVRVNEEKQIYRALSFPVKAYPDENGVLYFSAADATKYGNNSIKIKSDRTPITVNELKGLKQPVYLGANGEIYFSEKDAKKYGSKFSKIESKKVPVKYISDDTLVRVPKIIEKIKAETSQAVVGQIEIIEHILRAILCNGHILIEGVPGTAKTLIVKTIATIMGCDMKRVQFTVDLLPSDILGINSFNPDKKDFTFKKGPVFTNFLIADEINRSSPKTQSALLQAMQEKEIASGNQVYEIDKPFFVMATQNPIEQSGVYNLPEAEIDRFLFKINITYPKFEEEMKVLDTNSSLNSFETFKLAKVTSREEILELQEIVKKVYSSEEIKRYIVKIIDLTRDRTKEYSKYINLGASPRGSIALYVSSKAQALMNGRDYVLPEDVKNVAKPVLRHRIILNYRAESEGMNSDKIIEEILNQISPA